MAEHTLNFSQGDGGYNGSNAVVDDSNVFYLDLGKTESYATLEISDTSAGEVLSDYGDVLGIEVLIEDSLTNLGGGAQPNTFETSLYHTTSETYSDGIQTSIEHESAQTDPLIIGGASNKWGLDWSTSDINSLKIRLNNPSEPSGTANSIALIGTFIYVRITYDSTITTTGGKIVISNGNILLKQGKITL